MKKYFKFALRNLQKNKIYTSINIVGLTLGLAITIVLSILMIELMNFDRFKNDEGTIYRVIMNRDTVSNHYTDRSSALLAPTIAETFPEIINYTRYRYTGTRILKTSESQVSEEGIYADASWFEMLSFKLTEGKPGEVLDRPNKIVISNILSDKIFGDANPVGEEIQLYTVDGDNPETFIVSGVLDAFAQPSTISRDFIIPFDSYLSQNEQAKSWEHNNASAFIQVIPEANPKELSQKITTLLRETHPRMGENEICYLALPHKSNRFTHSLSGEPQAGFYIIIAAFIVGLTILLICFINYINLVKAMAYNRKKEVAVKKINGAGFKHLLLQFFMETFLVVVVAIFLAAILQYYLVKSIVPVPLSLSFYINFHLFEILVILLVITLAATSIYPAFYISRNTPMSLQRKNTGESFKLSFSRQTLVVVQFFFAIFLISTAIILSQQAGNLMNKSIGVDLNNTVYFNSNKQLDQRKDVFVQELQKMDGIESVTMANHLPFHIGNFTNKVEWQGKDPHSDMWFANLQVGDNYIETMKIKLIEGDFLHSGNSNKVIINEAAAERMGFDVRLGNFIKIDGNEAEIAGVIENHNTNTFYKEPLIISYNPDKSNMYFVRLNNVSTGLQSLEKTHSEFSPVLGINYTFLDDEFSNRLMIIRNLRYFLRIAGFFAIIIACLGLLGFVIHTTERRIKELGIRKINGARIADIIWLLSGRMLGMFAIAAAFAFPLAFLINNIVLEQFPTRINISIFHFLQALFIISSLTALIVSWQISKVARSNPVEVLRYE